MVHYSRVSVDCFDGRKMAQILSGYKNDGKEYTELSRNIFPPSLLAPFYYLFFQTSVSSCSFFLSLSLSLFFSLFRLVLFRSSNPKIQQCKAWREFPAIQIHSQIQRRHQLQPSLSLSLSTSKPNPKKEKPFPSDASIWGE